MREQVRHLAWILDSAYEIPGTKFRVGIDPLIGLIPILGELISVAIGGYIIMLATRIGIPRPILLRMMANLAIDAVLGAIPIVGDVLDAAWRANAKNAKLLDQAMTDPRSTARSSTRHPGPLSPPPSAPLDAQPRRRGSPCGAP